MTHAIQGSRLSQQQNRLWRHQLHAQLAFFFEASIEINGPLEPARLKRALGQIIDRHESLRTQFLQVPGMKTALQNVMDTPQLIWQEVDANHTCALDAVSWSENDTAQPQAILFKLCDDRHQLALRFSALCFDFQSLTHFMEELPAAYGGRLSEEEEPVQYLDFSEWQHEIRADEEAHEGLQFWNTLDQVQVNSWQPAWALTNKISGRSAQFAFSLPEAAISHAAPFLLACWSALLARFGDTENVSMNYERPARIDGEFDGAIGPFSVQAPLHLKVEQTLGHVHSELLDRIEELESFLEYVSYAEDEKREPELMFSMVEKPRTSPQQGLRFDLIEHRDDRGPFKLKLTCIRDHQSIQALIEYDSACFAPSQIEQLARSFTALVVSARPHADVASLNLLDSEQRQALVGNFNDTGTNYRKEIGIHQLFDEQAMRMPQQTALMLDDRSLSFDALSKRVHDLAAHLQTLGVGPETRVGLCIDRSFDLVVALFAILQAGGAYVAMDPEYPDARLDYILADSGAKFLLTNAANQHRFDSAETKVLAVDTLPCEGRRVTVTNFDPSQAAYIIYTSGSTGRPKGVIISHRNVVNYLSWCNEAYHTAESAGAPMHSSIGFDLTVTSLLAPLVAGKPVMLVPEEQHIDGLKQVLSLSRDLGPIKMTPSHLKVLGRDLNTAAIEGKGYLVLGGEALSPRDLSSWRSIAPEMQIVNEYGPTEATVGCCTYLVDEVDRPVVPIGKPIANSQLYLLDRALQPLPYCVSGELYISGDGLARGYLGKPRLTALAFLPNPFSTTPGSRMYRTGDLARFSSENQMLAYIGRRDGQVKIRGFRIELGEIEAAMRTIPSVEDAVAMARPEPGGTLRLVGYLVADKPPRIDEARSFLAQSLPDYMIPSIFVPLKSLPLTTNGKVDRDRLPEPGSERPEMGMSYVAPRNRLETLLVESWKEALGVDPIGIHDNFFALGGDSIRSVRAVALAQKKGIELEMQQLFQSPTIAGLAQQIQASSDIDFDEETLKAVESQLPTSEPFELISEADRKLIPADVVDAYPISGMQMGMLFHMEARADSAPIYHNVNIFKLRVHFELEAFQKAVDEAVKRHASLRTSFDLGSFSEPLQLVHESANLPVAFKDIRHLSKEEQDTLLDAFHREENLQVMDISKPPLLKLSFHMTGENEVVFTLCEPHSIADGWSQQLLLVEIFQIYKCIIEDEVIPDPPKRAVTYRDFIKLEKDTLQSPEALEYWTRVLDGATATRLPHWPSDMEIDAVGHRLYTEIPEDVIAGLNRLSQEAEVPLRTVMLAAHTKVLSVISGQDETMSAVSYNGRLEVPGGEKVLGLFLNTLPFRFHGAKGSWLDYVREVFRQETELLPHRRYPVSALQSRWGDQPLFEVGFNYIHFHSLKAIDDTGMVTSLGSDDLSRTNFPFATTFSRAAAKLDAMCFIFEYNASMFPTEQVETIREYYLNVLTAMSSDFSVSHKTFSAMPEDERNLLLNTWNDTAQDHQVPATLHEMIGAQIARTPDAVAVVCGEETLTYRQLDCKSNQLARYLHRHGLAHEDHIAIYMDRSLEMAIALLGILKIGAAYVPLDPAYPPERLAYMYADSQAKWVLTQSGLASSMAETGAKMLCLDSEWSEVGEETEQAIDIEVSPDNVAYIIYTSGSTGKPKGSMVSHRGICNTLGWRTRHFPMDGHDAVLQTTSFAFDASVWELFGPLISGARLVLSLPRGPEGRPHIPRLIREQGITAFQLPPSWLSVFLEEEDLESLPGPRYVITGAEPISKALQEKLFKRLKASFHNLYGPTEASLDVTCWQCQPDDRESYASIGKPIDNTRVYLLDANLMPVPRAVPGQLYIAGPGLARGYLNRPGLSADRFIPNPYATHEGERLYATGDLVRYRVDGNIDFMGRIDRQLKIRGARIEPGEIESVLRGHPQVADGVVHVHTDGTGQKRLVAYVVSSGEGTLTSPELREYLGGRLPVVLVPTAFVWLDRIPLTPNGKVDFKALPAPSAQETDAADTPPSSEIETLIADIWCEVIELEKVGIHTNFFDVGGTSLHIVRIHRKLKEALKQPITMVDLFKHATIHELARFISGVPLEETPEAVDRTELRKASKRRRGQRLQKQKNESDLELEDLDDYAL